MSRLVDRVERDLGHIADRATPSSTAWEEIQTRIAEQAEQPEMEIIMLQKKPPSAWQRPLVLGSIAAAVAVIVGVVLYTQSNGDSNSIRVTDEDTTETTVTTSAPTTAAPTTEAPSTTLPPTSSTLDPAEAVWQEIPLVLFPGVVGEFRTNTFGVPFKFDTAGVPYSKDLETENWFAISSDDVSSWVDVFVGLDSIEATVAEFQAMHDFYDSAQMSEPEPVTLGGADGVVFQSIGLPAGVAVTETDRHEFTAQIPSRGLWADASAYGIAIPGTSASGSDGVSIWVIDVNGRVVVVAKSALEMQVAVEDRPLIPQATQPLIDSIVWKDLR